MKLKITRLTNILMAGVLSFGASIVNAEGAKQHTLCVFDPIGANGPLFDQMKDYKVAALEWGVDLKMVPYTDERVAAEDFKAGLCDAVSVTGIRGRQFNSFTGTLDSIGSMPTYDHLSLALNTLSKPKAAKFMRNGAYEVAGIIPAGAAYLFVNDRKIDTIGEVSGKRIAYLDNDPAQKVLITNAGASPVASSITNMYSKFNNRSVDIVAAPAMLYEAMELYKGLKPTGAIVRYALAQVTIQLLVKWEAFPEGFGQKSREYSLAQFDRAVDLIKQAEADIPADWWLDIPAQDIVGYQETFRQSRIVLRDQGIYDGQTLKVLRVIRCKKDPSLAECTSADKE